MLICVCVCVCLYTTGDEISTESLQQRPGVCWGNSRVLVRRVCVCVLQMGDETDLYVLTGEKRERTAGSGVCKRDGGGWWWQFSLRLHLYDSWFVSKQNKCLLCVFHLPQLCSVMLDEQLMFFTSIITTYILNNCPYINETFEFWLRWVESFWHDRSCFIIFVFIFYCEFFFYLVYIF